MAEERVQRRLAAILVADVVGYSRLMEEDEAGTMAALADRRKSVWEPLLAKYRGRVIRTKGDSTLAEFASAVDAVQCAVEVQNAMKEANTKVLDGRVIILRIGLNLGDIVVENGDLYGDGVNVAARLESMADPGGICLSAAIHQQVERLLPFAFRDLGDQALKNIARPVRVYSISGDDRAAGASLGTGSPAGRAFSVPSRPSVAVLPFVNMSSDPEQAYFSDGITEDIITELSRFHSLFVIARNSSFQYRDKAADARNIASQLGVQYLVEGSVRKAGNQLRITAQLIDAATGNHLWADRYDRLLTDIFAVQDEVVHSIAGTLEVRLATSIASRARRKPTQNMAAYECVLRSREHYATYDAAGAEPLLRNAIELDPSYAQAWAWLSLTHASRFYSDSRTELLDQALVYARKAVALDESDTICHFALAQILIFRRQFDLAGLHSNRALALNPSDVTAIGLHAHWLCRMGRLTEALQTIDIVLQRDPSPPSWYWELRAITLLAARRYEEAIASVRHMTRLHPQNYAYLAACHAQLGQEAEARANATEVLRLMPDFTANWLMLQEPFKNPADAQPMLEGLRKAGLPE